jgi:hypothetical protein
MGTAVLDLTATLKVLKWVKTGNVQMGLSRMTRKNVFQ